MVDLPAEHEAYLDELQAAVDGVLRHGRFIMGPEVGQLEQEIAGYLDVSHAVSCNSGTDALILAFRALGVGPGDEVVTTPLTFVATAEAICSVGATPVFVDIDAATCNIDPEQIPAALTPRTRAIVPVHLYGQPADMAEILAIAGEHGLSVVEDTAQGFGARYDNRAAGTLGNCGTYSFFPTKPLGGVGDGGLVVTDDAGIADQVAMLRAHGARKKHENEVVGYNSRLDTLQAAILRVKLRYVDSANKARQRAAEHYDSRLGTVPGLVTPPVAPGRTHVYHQYVVRILDGRRSAVQNALSEAGIESLVHYPVLLHQLTAYRGTTGALPVAEEVVGQILSLPMAPTLTEAAADEVADIVTAALTN
jgi:dTDP-4-amino-4,6-dideoxygalactose transaminase